MNETFNVFNTSHYNKLKHYTSTVLANELRTDIFQEFSSIRSISSLFWILMPNKENILVDSHSFKKPCEKSNNL